MLASGRWKRVAFTSGLVAVLVAGAVIWWWLRPPAYRPLEAAFDGDSSQLAHTVVVPTLDTPLPEGKSAVWCSSFQIAWDRLRDDVAGGPFSISGAEDVAERLERARGAADDLEASSYFADAGLMKDGIVERIRRGMKTKFPDAPAADLPEGAPETVAVAYAYLRAAVDFEKPYDVSEEPLVFRDGAGDKHKVRAFGALGFGNKPSKKQIDVLHTAHAPQRWALTDFVLDLSKTSRPYQLLLARIQRKDTLEATLADLRDKLAVPPKEERQREFGSLDTLLVPFLSFRLSHDFQELEGESRRIRGSRLDGLHVGVARQTIDFRLDPMGARVASSAPIEVKGDPRQFYFDRPFLIVMRKRGSTRPFFVAWIEHAELMLRPE
jgi:hypothetical protein